MINNNLIMYWMILAALASGLNAQPGSGQPDVPAAPATVSEQVVSGLMDVCQSSGAMAGDNSGHGGNQARIVRTSHGTYAAYISIGDNKDFYSFSFVRIEDQKAVLIYQDTFRSGSSSIHIMADANEDLWLYAGASQWVGHEEVVVSLWHYDQKTQKVTPYKSLQQLPLGSSYGYSTPVMDVSRQKIYALFCGGDEKGYLIWLTFDLKTRTFSPIRGTEIQYRHCYLYGFPSRNGGIRLVGERDITNEAAGIADALKTYKNRKIDANYVWDELRLFIFPDMDSNLISQALTVQNAVYDFENGLYPTVKNSTGGDAFEDRDGNLHVLYTADDNGIKGRFFHHAIFNAQNQCVFNQQVSFSKKYDEYEMRMYQSKNGTFYIAAVPVTSGVPAQVEIWKSTDKDGHNYEMVHGRAFSTPAMSYSTPYSLILSSTRNGSVVDDIADCLLIINNNWYHFTINFGTLKDTASENQGMAE